MLQVVGAEYRAGSIACSKILTTLIYNTRFCTVRAVACRQVFLGCSDCQQDIATLVHEFHVVNHCH